MLNQIYVRYQPDGIEPFFYVWWPIRESETTCIGLEGGLDLPQKYYKNVSFTLPEVLDIMHLETANLRLVLTHSMLVNRDPEHWALIGDGTPYLSLIQARHNGYDGTESLLRLENPLFWEMGTIQVPSFKTIRRSLKCSKPVNPVVWA